MFRHVLREYKRISAEARRDLAVLRGALTGVGNGRYFKRGGEPTQRVRLALLGSVLSNTLLVLGCAFLAGGLRQYARSRGGAQQDFDDFQDSNDSSGLDVNSWPYNHAIPGTKPGGSRCTRLGGRHTRFHLDARSIWPGGTHQGWTAR